MTWVRLKCLRCGEIITRWPKENRPSNLVMGAERLIHMVVCDRESFDAHIARHFGNTVGLDE